MLKPSKFLYQLMAFVLMASIGVACKEDTVEPVTPPPTQDTPNPNLATNNWIYDVMKEAYLWTDELPAQPDKNQEPDAFFKSLLSSKDRFSHIVPDYQALISSLNGVNQEAGYEFMLARASQDNEDVIALVLYVKPNSPAKEAGLMRGDKINKINGQSINLSNYRALIGKTSENHSIDYQRYNKANSTYEQQASVSLNAVELAENPNFLDSVYVAANGKKVGYMVYNFFSPGANNTKEYDNGVDQVIAEFKSKGVNELILDLRYNSGGAVSSATNLASLIGKGVSSSKIFYQNQWNKLYQDYLSSRPDGDDILRGKFKDKAVNIGNDLASGTVYVLVGSRTASASELIINGLKPYMDVVIIGEKTVGKNVGSIPIEDKENSSNKWGLLPIVFQISNSLGSSDYATGFVPAAGNDISEFKSLPFKELGDVNEPLLARALALISGEGARIGTKSLKDTHSVEPIMSSLDRKAYSNRVIMDKEIF